MSQIVDRYFGIGLVILYMLFALPLIPIGTGEIRMVAVFSIDESDILSQVHRLYEGGIFQRPSFTYGGGVYYAVLLLVWIWDLFFVVDEQVIAIALRVYCWLAGVGCLWLVMRLGENVFDKRTGQIAAFLLLIMPVFLRWTVEGHPDLPQLFWVLCTLLFCIRLCRVFHLREGVLATAFAGIAFGTKYGGGFLLPVIGASVFLSSEENVFRLELVKEHLKDPSRWLAIGLMPFVFVGTFALLNPFAILDFDLFLQKMQSYRSVMSAGHTFVGESAWYLWLTMMVSGLGLLQVVVFCAGLLSEKRFVRVDRLLLLLWCITLLTYLMSQVQMRHMRHVLPILPCILLFVASGYGYLSDYLGRKSNQPKWVFLVLLMGLGIWGRAQASIDLFEHKWAGPSNREEVVAGRWLADHYSEETTILYDAYAYIPGKFQKALPATPAMTYPVVNHFEPVVLVLRDARYSRYSALSDSNQVSINKGDFFDIHYFYPYIQAGLLPDYVLKKSFDRTFVFERSLPRNHRFDFASCYQMLQNGQMLNEAVARERMGDAAIQAGDWHEAVRQYVLAVHLLPDQVMLHYKLGRAYALIGAQIESQEQFSFVLDRRQNIGDLERANIYWDMAQFFFAGALYETAASYLDTSLRLNPDSPEVHFDLAACQLALGNGTQARNMYRDALQRFGRLDIAVVKLKALLERGVQNAIVTEILKDDFEEM